MALSDVNTHATWKKAAYGSSAWENALEVMPDQFSVNGDRFSIEIAKKLLKIRNFSHFLSFFPLFSTKIHSIVKHTFFKCQCSASKENHTPSVLFSICSKRGHNFFRTTRNAKRNQRTFEMLADGKMRTSNQMKLVQEWWNVTVCRVRRFFLLCSTHTNDGTTTKKKNVAPPHKNSMSVHVPYVCWHF